MGKKIQYIGRYVMDGETLGKGNFAPVELATHGVTGCKVAIKVIDTRKIKEDYVKQNLHREARILGQLRHPNIIRLYETLKATTLYCLVTEYASGGEILAYIKMHPHCRLLEDKARPFVRQLVSAVHYLHERGVSHRDLKMENIMLDEKKTNIKIVDFGLSNTFTLDDLMKTHCGSPEYAAPELFTAGEKYGPEIDIWSLGIIMYAMVVGKLPFTTPYTDQYRRQKLLQQIEKGLVDQHEKEMSHLTSDCQDLIGKLIAPSPELRLPLMDIEIHSWITLEAKLPFYPFQCLPKDKATKSQVVEELASLLDTDKAQLEKTVHECRCDEISAMYNMMLQRKRIEKGLFDVDHTQEQNSEVRPRSRSRQRAKSAGRNQKSKGSVKHKTSRGGKTLNVPHTSNEQSNDAEGAEKHDQSTTSASFDLLALCSTPSWLGPERRRSRRRSRAPPTSPSPYADVGATGTLASVVSGLGAAMAHGHDKHLVEQACHSLSLTVPNRLPVPHNPESQPPTHDRLGQLSRENSLKVPNRENSVKRINYRHSDKRPSSCGPSVRRRASSLRKANSVDTDSPPPSLEVRITVPPPPIPNSPKTTPKTEEHRQSPIPRPVQLGLKDCFNPQSKLAIKSSSLVPPNGPQTCVQIQLSDYSNPCSITALDYDPESTSREALLKVELDSGSRAKHNSFSLRHENKTAHHVENTGTMCRNSLQQVCDERVVRPKEKPVIPNNSPCLSRRTCVPALQCLSQGYGIPQEVITSPYSPGPSLMSSSSSDSLLESMQINNLANLSEKDTPDISTLSTDLFSRTSSDLAMLSPLSLDFRDITTTASKDPSQDSMCNSEKLSLRGNIQDSLICASVCNSTVTNQNFSLCKNIIASVPCDQSISRDSNILRQVTAEISGSHSFKSVKENCVNKAMRRNSMQSLQTPTTPTRQLLKTPIARVESFHSDDFDEYQGDDVPVLRTPTPQTPTGSKVIFQSKANVKKTTKESLLSKFSTRSSKEVNRLQGQDKLLRLEPGITESLLESADSDVSDRNDGSTEKLTLSNKIHPKENLPTEVLKPGSSIGDKPCKNRNKDQVGITSGKANPAKQKQKTAPQKDPLLNAQDSKKKPALKSSPWKRSFAHFLRKTKPCRNINNKDIVKDGDLVNTQPQHSNTNSNGHAHSPVSKTAPVSLHDNHEGGRENAGWPVSLPPPLHNNISDAIEVTSPSHQESTGTTVRLFDFSNVHPNIDSSPKAKRGFLSWRGCRECGRSDSSSEEGSECGIRLEQLNTNQKPTTGANNVGESRLPGVPSENVCC